jgi:3-oxoacyl-(acyl-carrier-protein) synthase/NADP-dependent 3-hydroxy acid dehydrogenase YdfG
MRIAIVAVACQLPEAPNLAAFRRNLAEGRDSVRVISQQRRIHTGLDLDEALPEIAFIEDIDCFDYRFFRMSKSEADNMDPQHRLLLQTVYHAMESANYPKDKLAGTKTDVLLAAMKGGYATIADPFDPTSITGNMTSAAAGRISRFLDLRGSAAVVDTACSSGLIALEIAAQNLENRRCDYAIVGAANLRVVAESTATMFLSGILSPGFRARSFSDDADGTGCGEAVGVIILRRMDDAVADGDTIHAVLRGVCSNQDGGRSATLTAPDATAQAEVLQAAWDAASIAPESLVAIETHGSATRLGDPIEVRGLNLAFAKYTDRREFCAINSIKSNIGHCDTAAGLVGLIRAILTVKYGEYYPAVNYSQANKLINFATSAVFVNKEYKRLDLQRKENVLVGVTSLSLMGTNSHAVLESPPTRVNKFSGPRRRAVMISGADEEALQSQVRNLLAHLEGAPEIDIGELADVLLHGRTHFQHRKAVVAQDIEDLKLQLRQIRDAGSVASSPSRSLVAVFSEAAAIPDENLSPLLADDPVFASEFTAAGGMAASNPRLRAFAFQYALVRRLQNAGVQITSSLGEGLGRLVIDTIKGNIALPQASASCADTSPSTPPTAERIRGLIASLDEGTVFVEVGKIGHISEALAAHFSQRAISQRLISLSPNLDIESFLAEIYCAGANWVSRGASGLAALELPHYPFRRDRCWRIRRQLSHVTETRVQLADWMHCIVWRPRNTSVDKRRDLNGHRYLLWTPEITFANLVVKRLEVLGAEVVVVDGCDVDRCEKLLANTEGNWSGLIDLSLLTAAIEPTSESFHIDLDRQFVPFAESIKRVTANLQNRNFRYVCISASGQITNGRDFVDPAQAACISLLRSLLTENVRADVLSIDIDLQSLENPESLADSVVADIRDQQQLRFIAFRGGERLVPALEPILDQRPAIKSAPIRSAVIMGGSGGLGMEVALRLGSRGNCHLILLGRRAKLDSSSVTRLKDLEARGTSYVYHSVALAEQSSLTDLLENERLRLQGRVDCVVHAAGIAGDAETRIEEKMPAMYKDTFQGKVFGALHLMQALSNFEVGQHVAFSSLAAVIPPRLRADYASANACLDAIAHRSRLAGQRFRSIRWPPWGGFLMGLPPTQQPAPQELTLQGGLQLFEAMLVDGDDNPVITRVDPALRFNPFLEIAGLTDRHIDAECPDIAASSHEREVWNVWRDVLGHGSFGLDSDFYALGGHSLIAVQLLNQLEQKFGVLLELPDLLGHPTVRSFAPLIIDTELTPSSVVFPKLRESDGPVKASNAQIGLWIQAYRSREKRSHNEVLAYEICGSIDLDRIQNLVQQLVSNQESLRTSFEYAGGEVFQSVHDKLTVDSYLEVRELSDPAAVDLALVRATDIAFDLSQLPLFRIAILRVANDRVVVLIVAHHVISDGWSNKVLLDEVFGAYRGLRSISIPAVTYREYSAWDRGRVAAPEGRRKIEFWRDSLKGYRGINLPYDFPKPTKRSYRGARAEVACDGAFGNLDLVARSQAVSAYSVALAIVLILISKWSAVQDIVILSPVHGRTRRELENVIGCFVNLLCLRCKVDDTLTLRELIALIWTQERIWLSNQEAPFHEVVGVSGLDIDLHQVGLTWDTEESDEIRWDGVEIRRRPMEGGWAKADLWFFGRIVEGQLSLIIEYSTDVFEDTTIELLGRRLAKLIDQAPHLLEQKIRAINSTSGLEDAPRVKLNMDL